MASAWLQVRIDASKNRPAGHDDMVPCPPMPQLTNMLQAVGIGKTPERPPHSATMLVVTGGDVLVAGAEGLVFFAGGNGDRCLVAVGLSERCRCRSAAGLGLGNPIWALSCGRWAHWGTSD